MVKLKTVQLGKNTRQSFSKINEVIEMPNLIGIQRDSYEWFLDEGIAEVFKDVSPITDSNGKFELSFIDHRLDDKTKYTIEECKERDATYAAPLRVTARLLSKETGEIMDNEIFMGDLPLMTDSGTFVINGSERVVVSQLVRSPGVYYGFDYDKTGKKLFKATVIPNRGAWLEYEMDSNDVFYVRIDKNRKIPATTFLRSIGLSSNEELKEKFGEDDRIIRTVEDKDNTQNREEALLEVYKKLRPGEPPTVESAQNHLNTLFFDAKRYDLSRFGRYKYNKKLAISARLLGAKAAETVIAPLTGEILAEEGAVITDAMALAIENAGVTDVTVINAEGKTVKVVGNGMVDINCYASGLDFEALGINEQVRFAVLAEILEEAAGDNDKLAELLKARAEELIPKHITLDDIYATVSYFINLCEGIGDVDDIDHLGNRRIRCVGELLQNQFRIGFSRMERTIRERMALQAQDQEKVSPSSLINARQVISAMREFFGSSPLSQFMDQNNPLAELTHKRRLSSLGPGGLSRDRAGFEVRDVHYSHYGRMCPIETPEGPNIGLISYLATFAKINEYGFIEAPLRKVDKETGMFSISGSANLPTGKYSISVACRFDGVRMEFKDAISINMLKPIPEGIYLKPSEMTVGLAAIREGEAELPTAQIVTDGNRHVEIKKHLIANVYHNGVVANECKEWFDLNPSTGKLTIVPGNQSFDAGVYTFDFKLTTYVVGEQDEEGIFPNALRIDVTSAPYGLTYNPTSVLIEKGYSGKSGKPEFKGSKDELVFTLKSVSPSNTIGITVDDATGTIRFPETSAVNDGDQYIVSVTATNKYGTKDFDNIFF